MLATSLGTSRVLSVPYLAQPTDTTCQATVLKMMAMYLERLSPPSSPNAASLDIVAIKTGEIGPGQSCRLPITAASRQRKGDSALGLFTLLAARL